MPLSAPVLAAVIAATATTAAAAGTAIESNQQTQHAKGARSGAGHR